MGLVVFVGGIIIGEVSSLCDAGNGFGGDAINVGTYC